MENKREEAQAHSHLCVTVLYPRNTVKKDVRRIVGSFVRSCLIHSHTHCHRHCHRRHCTSLMHFRRSPPVCGYKNDYIVYSPDYVIPIAQNGKKSLTHEWMAETSGWDSERKEHQFISLELTRPFFLILLSFPLFHARVINVMRSYIYIRITRDIDSRRCQLAPNPDYAYFGPVYSCEYSLKLTREVKAK